MSRRGGASTGAERRTPCSPARPRVLRLVAGLAAVTLAVVSGGLVATSAAADEPDLTTLVTAADPGSNLSHGPTEQPTDQPGDEPGDGGAEEVKEQRLDDADASADASGLAEEGPAEAASTTPDAVTPSDAVERADARGPPAPGGQHAVTPAADAAHATVVVRTGAPGTRLGLATEASEGVPLTFDWAEATSGANGEAVFTIPVRSTTGGAITADGVAKNQQLWVRAVTAPAGYSLPTTLGGGPLTASANDQHRLLPYAFQTPKLVAGETSRSGVTFMSQPSQTGTSDARYSASSGTWAVVRDNPTMPRSCSGLDVALVLDFSASVTEAQVAQVKSAANAYIDALGGTPSSMQVFPFGTKALTASSKHALTTQSNVDYLKRYVTQFSRPSNQYTNWDSALSAIPTGVFDVIVVVTDGMPTVYGNGSTAGGSGVTRFVEMEAAIAAANEHKSARTRDVPEGTHIRAFGVGNGISSPAALANLEAIASKDAVTRTGDYAAVAASLRAQVLADCTPSVSVTKLVEPWNGGVDDRTPAAGWEFTASVDGMAFGEEAPTQTTPDGGGVMWRFKADQPGDLANVTITEAQQPGYRIVPQAGQNAACVVKNASTPVEGSPLRVTDADDGFTIADLAGGDMVTCTVVNKEPAPPVIGGLFAQGRAHVDYDWAITKEVTNDPDGDRTWETTPGEDVSVDYRLTVSATKDVSPLDVEGWVTVTNPSSAEQTLSLPSVTVGGVAATVHVPSGEAPVVAGGGAVTLRFTAALGAADLEEWMLEGGEVPVVVSVPHRPDTTSGLNLDDVVRTVRDATAVVGDDFPELARAYSPAERTLDAEAVIAAGGTVFVYTAERGGSVPADASATFVNTATVTPSDTPGGDPREDDENQDAGALTDDETVTVRTPPQYDLALRLWVAEVWRDGVMVFERNADPSDAGPDYAIPHVTFDHTEVDIRVGDLVVHDIHLFNQGDRTARVEEIVNYRAPGLELATTESMDGVEGHDNAGWELAGDGLLHLPMGDAGLVLAPGTSSEVSLTLQVALDAPEEDEYVDRFSFAEISRFSGWVPASRPAAAGAVFAAPLIAARGLDCATALAVPLAAEVHDGVAGAWSADVLDADSVPDRHNGGIDPDEQTLVYHSWEDNEIDERNTTMLWDDESTDHDNDEDDHDGSIIRVARTVATVPEGSGAPGPGTNAPAPGENTAPAEPQGSLVSAPVTLPVTGATVAATAAVAVLLAAVGVLLVVSRRARPRV
ncbi:VWA domain-containing protein [Xylanimonas allomyrinae]|uniref:VWA domain-containing protein n=1 Tax=Xylanimonas allomyrinae TaxID=2509459 RepID=A0A4P6ERU1_9MICO|nr:vWA domain-containing protein [Xylanimonas allomyrinae]QAY64229.1 VWA domain-containing protein [Xylanimonas allomyrinae]